MIYPYGTHNKDLTGNLRVSPNPINRTSLNPDIQWFNLTEND